MLNKISPFRAPARVEIQDKTQLKEALAQAGKMHCWNVEKLSPDSILAFFKRNGGDILRQTLQDTRIGARTIGKTWATYGAIAGGLFGIVGGVAAGIAFPPSLLFIAMTATVNGALGAAIGGVGGMVLGGLYKGAKTALSLVLTSPRQRLMRHARTGRAKLNRLKGKEMARPLNKKEQVRIDHLRQHVPLWEYAAHNLKSRKSDQFVESVVSFDTSKQDSGNPEQTAIHIGSHQPVIA